MVLSSTFPATLLNDDTLYYPAALVYTSNRKQETAARLGLTTARATLLRTWRGSNESRPRINQRRCRFDTAKRGIRLGQEATDNISWLIYWTRSYQSFYLGYFFPEAFRGIVWGTMGPENVKAGAQLWRIL